jgi:hypothetical protein
MIHPPQQIEQLDSRKSDRHDDVKRAVLCFERINGHGRRLAIQVVHEKSFARGIDPTEAVVSKLVANVFAAFSAADRNIRTAVGFL